MTSGVIAGAIRWDAWYNVSSPSGYAQRSLGPMAWENRAPWFCTAHPTDNLIDANGDRQLIMDLEIGYAAAAGLKFWAFDQYDPASANAPLLTAWKFYQQSTLNAQINWCWIALADSLFGSTGNYSAQVAQYVSWFQQSNYQKVLVGRPLLFLFFTTFPSFGNDATNFAAAISALRGACTSAGLASPYIVVMGPPASASTAMQAIGADAISHYLGGIPLGVAGATYASLINTSVTYWGQYLATGNQVIPTVQMGWDKRPRIQNPVPWDPSPSSDYVMPGTIAERVSLLQSAVNFVNANPAACASKAVIIYAWDECDEGGGALIPTIGDPPTGAPPALNGMLSAIKPVIS
jgi:hypothetical protein